MSKFHFMCFCFVVILPSMACAEVQGDRETVNCLVELTCVYLKWKHLVIFTDSSIDNEKKQQLIRHLHNCNASITSLVHDVGTSPALNQLWTISFTSYKINFVIWASSKVVTEIFQQYNQYFLCRLGHRWLIVSHDYSPEKTVGYLTSVQCHLAVIYSKPEGVVSVQRLSNQTRHTVAGKCLRNGTYNALGPVYHDHPRLTLNGRNLTVTLEKHFPFFIPPSESTIMAGVDINLLQILRLKLNFSYVIKRPPDKNWGALINQSWNGMIGMVVRKEADIALGGMTASVDRIEAVDFSSYYAFDRLTFATRAPKEASRTWIIIFPFSWKVWVTFGFAVIFTSLILAGLEESKRRIYVSADVHKNEHNKMSYHNVLFCTFKSILNQDCISSSSNATRIMIVTWFIFTITAVCGYSGSLTSFMTYPGTVEPMDSVRKLVAAVKKGKYQCGTMKDSSDHNLFKRCIPSARRIYTAELKENTVTRWVLCHTTEKAEEFEVLLRNMESRSTNFVANDKAGLKKSLRENYAYIAGEMTVYADMWNPKLFIFSKDSFRLSGYAVAFAKDFWYKEAFNRWILRIQEAGLIEMWIRHLIEPTQAISMPPDSIRPLTMDDIQGAFWLMLIGHALAAAVLLLNLLTVCLQRILQTKFFNTSKEKIRSKNTNFSIVARNDTVKRQRNRNGVHYAADQWRLRSNCSDV